MIPCPSCGSEESRCNYSSGSQCMACGASLDGAGMCDHCDRGIACEDAVEDSDD